MPPIVSKMFLLSFVERNLDMKSDQLKRMVDEFDAMSGNDTPPVDPNNPTL
jgi:hypothetical protein